MKFKTTSPISCLLGLWALFLIGCAPSGGFRITPVPADQTLKEQVVYRESVWTGNRILLLDIGGVLLNAHEPGFFGGGEHVVSLIVEKLYAAEKDDRVKAVVLRINSPGGTVTASDTVLQEIKQFKLRTKKPVIAYFQDVAASGAYYLACGADEILAQRTTVTGSIGVIMQMFDLSDTMNKLGIQPDAITSGPFKDSGSPFRTMRPEERKLFQGLVDNFYNQFVMVVEEGRPKLTHEQVLKLADGRVYSAEQALDAGLIDGICTLREAIDAAKKRAKITTANTVQYHRPQDWTPNIYAQSPTPQVQNFNIFNVNLPSLWTERPIFLYIWSVR